MYVKTNMIYKIRSYFDLQNDHTEDMWIEATDVNNTFFWWVHYTLILITVQNILEKFWKIV